MTDFKALLTTLSRQNVKFIIVGGAASVAHGSSRLTQDLDIVYERTKENIHNLVHALKQHQPYLRGAPKGLPFIFDEKSIHAGLNFTLTTNLGDLDLLGEIVGGGDYQKLSMHTINITLFGLQCACLNLETLIKVKRAAGRPKDFEVIAELEEIQKNKSTSMTHSSKDRKR